MVLDHLGQGLAGVEVGVQASVLIAQAVGEQLQTPTQAGLERWRQYQVEVALQFVRRQRLQVQVQGVTLAQPTRLGQVLLGQQPADFHLRQASLVTGQHIQPHRRLLRLGQANLHFTAREEVVALAQHQHTVNQLGILRGEGLTVELAVQGDIQFSRRLGRLLQPAQAENRLQARGVMRGQQGQADDQRDATQGQQAHGLARGAPVTQHIDQGHRRNQATPAPQQAGGEGQHHQPDQASQNQQQAAEDQQRVHSVFLVIVASIRARRP